jgi:hypothetical protein
MRTQKQLYPHSAKVYTYELDTCLICNTPLVLQRNVDEKLTKKRKAWYSSPSTSQVKRRKYHAPRNYNRNSVY